MHLDLVLAKSIQCTGDIRNKKIVPRLPMHVPERFAHATKRVCVQTFPNSVRGFSLENSESHRTLQQRTARVRQLKCLTNVVAELQVQRAKNRRFADFELRNNNLARESFPVAFEGCSRLACLLFE